MSAPPVNGAPHWPANDDDRVGLARAVDVLEKVPCWVTGVTTSCASGSDLGLVESLAPRSAAWLHSFVSSVSAGSSASDCVLGAAKVLHPVGAPPMAGPAWRVGAARGAGMVRARSGELGWR